MSDAPRAARVDRAAFADVEVFSLFVGYTRSGHSLVGTVLDAHPEAVVAHEGKIFATDERGSLTGELRHARRDDLFEYLVQRSARQAFEGHRGFRRMSGSSNLIPGGHHGEFTRLRVIGNKRGQEPPIVWELNPAVFDQLRAMTGVETRLVHVYRNPWDNIASMGRFHDERAVGKYFRRVRDIQRIRDELGIPMHDIALEDLVADPAGEVRRLLEFHDLPVDEELLAACAQRIDTKVSASRLEREWPPEMIKRVRKRLKGIPWLERYPRTPAE